MISTIVELELTKEVQIYRASPDPLYYSTHPAGLPSSVHVYALTAERPAVDVSSQGRRAFAHLDRARKRRSTRSRCSNRRGPARKMSTRTDHDEPRRKATITEHKQSVELARRQGGTVTFPLKLAAYGLHDVKLTVTDGAQTLERDAQPRLSARRHAQPRRLGLRPRAAVRLLELGRRASHAAGRQAVARHGQGRHRVRRPARSRNTPSAHGDKARKVMEKYKIFTLKFAGAGDHYITAKFATDLKTLGLEKARENFLKTLKNGSPSRRAEQPAAVPVVLSRNRPSGPVTHGIFPTFIGEPETPFTRLRKRTLRVLPQRLRRRGEDRPRRLSRGEVPAAARRPGVRRLTSSSGNPQRSPSYIDGVTVDIPCFERLPEQQFHQVALHRLYMARKEMADAGITKPLLPMYEGPVRAERSRRAHRPGAGRPHDPQQPDLDGLRRRHPERRLPRLRYRQLLGRAALRLRRAQPHVARNAQARLHRAGDADPAPEPRQLPQVDSDRQPQHLLPAVQALQDRQARACDVDVARQAAGHDRRARRREGHRLRSEWTTRSSKLAGRTARSRSRSTSRPATSKGSRPTPRSRSASRIIPTRSRRPAPRSSANLGDGAWTGRRAEGDGIRGKPHALHLPLSEQDDRASRSSAPAAQGGKALAVHFEKPEKERVVRALLLGAQPRRSRS